MDILDWIFLFGPMILSFAVMIMIGLAVPLARAEERRKPGPPPSLYDYCHKKITAASILLADYDFYNYYPVRDPRPKFLEYTRAVDTYAKTGDTSLIPKIESAARPLLDQYDAYCEAYR